MPQYHLIVAVDVDSNGSVTDVAVDYDGSLSSAHFPFGNVYDGGHPDDKELMAEWRTATSAAYATDKESPTADPGWDVAVEHVEKLLAAGRAL